MTQIQLSDAQAVILSTACTRADAAVFPVTASLKGGAVGNVCKSLLKHGLIEETPATDLNTVYRHDEERGPLTLRATPLAYSALGITDNPGAQAEDPEQGIATAAPVHRRSGTKPGGAHRHAVPVPRARPSRSWPLRFNGSHTPYAALSLEHSRESLDSR